MLRAGTVKVRGNFLSLIAYVFQNRGGPCNYRLQEEEMKRQLFGLMCKGGRLWLFAGNFWSFAGGLLLFAGSLWSFAGLWPFAGSL